MHSVRTEVWRHGAFPLPDDELTELEVKALSVSHRQNMGAEVTSLALGSCSQHIFNEQAPQGRTFCSDFVHIFSIHRNSLRNKKHGGAKACPVPPTLDMEEGPF